MSIAPRPVAALAVVIGSFASIGLIVGTATPVAAQPACTDSWIGPTTGTTNWNASAANWSSGLPGGSSVVCINEAGTYTVLWNGTGSAAAVEVGGAGSGTQTFEVNGGNFPSTQDDTVESGGALSLVPSSSSAADFSGGGSNGVTIDAGGALFTSGTTQEANVGLPLVNQGSMTLGATSNVLDGDTINNEGSISIPSGSTVTESAAIFTDASGSLVNNGTFNGENEWIQSGTDESGNPVLTNGTFVDSAGTGSFQVDTTTIEGTVPAGQMVTALGSDAMGTASAGVTVGGTLDCETTSNSPFCSFYTDNNTWPGITVAAGGTVETSGPGSKAQCGNSGCATLSANMEIDAGGTLSVANLDTAYSPPAGGSTLTNAGTVQVTSNGWLLVSGCGSFESTGTVEVTVGSSVTPPVGGLGWPGTIESDQCPANVFDVSGTLAVDTDGSPAGQTVITRAGAPSVTGTFSSFSFGPDYYTVNYSSGEVAVAPATPFSASPTPFSAAEEEPVTNPQVATFNSNSEPGPYSATVDYGDGTGMQAASVNVNGTSGTVTGPTHIYTAPGTYTVTTVISTTAGTTIPVSESITVTGPTITGFSTTKVRPGRSISTTVKGTDFDGTGAPSGFTTSDPSKLSVTSVTFHAATRRTAATYTVKLTAARGAHRGKVSITLTQTGNEAGITTANNAVTIR